MTSFLADEHVSYHLVRALRRLPANVDLVTVQELNMAGSDDETVLDRAHADGRIVITSDRNTMLGIRHARVAVGAPVPGIVIIETSTRRFERLPTILSSLRRLPSLEIGPIQYSFRFGDRSRRLHLRRPAER
jgi:hypothetical protein